MSDPHVLTPDYAPRPDPRYTHRFETVYPDGGGWAIAGWGWYCWQGMGKIQPRAIFGQILWLHRHGDHAAAHALTEQAVQRLPLTPKIANQIVKDSLAANSKGGK